MKKQIILLMTDTTRKDMLGCYGNEKMLTPNLDSLSENGVRYENAYTTQAVCGPARSALFTGLFPHSNGSVANSVPLSENVKTIGQRLDANNINCGYIGKWHLDGGDYFGYGKCADGYNEKYWYDMKNYLDELSDEDKVRSRLQSTAYEIEEDFTFAHRCSNRAIDFLDEFSNEDFFLTVSYDEPHHPFLCPAPYNTMYKGFKFDDNPTFHDDLSEKPLLQKLWANKRLDKTADEINIPSESLQLFLGCNSYVDYEIGRVLDKIKEVVPNALIIYTSDHGDMLGSHKMQSKGPTAYKEAANIPLIISGGEKNKVITEPSSHIHIVPTVLDYFDLTIPKVLEGKSLLPQIYDTNVKINEYSFVEFTRFEIDHDNFGGLQMMRACVSEGFKLVINLFDLDELYDLGKDPFEMKNLINDENYSEFRNKLHDVLLENMNNTRDVYRGYQWAIRPWRKDKFPSWTNDGHTRQRPNEEGEPCQLDYDNGLPITKTDRAKNTSI